MEPCRSVKVYLYLVLFNTTMIIHSIANIFSTWALDIRIFEPASYSFKNCCIDTYIIRIFTHFSYSHSQWWVGLMDKLVIMFSDMWRWSENKTTLL